MTIIATPYSRLRHAVTIIATPNSRHASIDHRDQSRHTNAPFSESRKKKRHGASPKTKELRKLIRSPTRRRFFTQCVNPDSLLWKNWGSGSKSMNQLLFSRAAQDPMDEVYELYPGPLYSTTGGKVLKAMRWRVTKDRNNWMGKVPKKKLFTGNVSHYDWEKNYNSLRAMDKKSDYETLAKSLSMTSQVSTASSTVSDVSNYNKEPNVKTHWHRMYSCRGCGVSVWFGDEPGPKGMSRCFPENYDWKLKVRMCFITSPGSPRYLLSLPSNTTVHNRRSIL